MGKLNNDLLFDLVSRFPEGASLEEIMVGLIQPIPRRTLQRRLSTLVENHLLIATGQTRSRRYKLPESKLENIKHSSLISISLEGSKIQAAVSRPLQARSPVTYHRTFLEEYQPNQTFYLNATERKK